MIQVSDKTALQNTTTKTIKRPLNDQKNVQDRIQTYSKHISAFERKKTVTFGHFTPHQNLNMSADEMNVSTGSCAAKTTIDSQKYASRSVTNGSFLTPDLSEDEQDFKGSFVESYDHTDDHQIGHNTLPDLLSIDHRKAQILQLVSFLDLYNYPNTIPNVQFINGYRSSGVNYVMRELLKHYSSTGFEHIIVKKGNVIDHKSLMRDIGRQLYTLFSTKYAEEDINNAGNEAFEEENGGISTGETAFRDTKNTLNYTKIKNIKSGLDARAIETFSSFKDYLQNLLLYFDIYSLRPTSIYIFLQEFDQYPLLDYNTVFRFCKIAESLSGSKFQIKLIFSFEEISAMNQYLGGMMTPVITQFPRYTFSEVQSILSNHLCKDLMDINESFSQQFISFCCESFVECLGFDLKELEKVIRYKYTLSADEIDYSGYNFAKFIHRNREMFQEVEVSVLNKRKHSDSADSGIEYDGKKRQVTDKYSNFSKMTKYLLISSYYCSYYPTKMDSVFFRKNINDNLASKAKTSKTAEHQYKVYTEPRGFPLERLLLIFNIFFYQDSDESEENLNVVAETGTDMNCSSSFTQLLDYKYIGKNINDYFDCYRTDCKYKLLLPPSEIKKIAESVDFERPELIIG